MSEVTPSTTQTQPTATSNPAPTTGPSVEELQAKVAEFERTREGLIRDLQQERARRQELEQRTVVSPPAPSAEPQNDVTQDELGKVISPYVAPVLKRVQQMEAQAYEDKAFDYLASKLGKTRDDIMADTDFQRRLVNTAAKWGFRGNAYDVTKRTMEIMEMEELKAKEVERARAVSAAATTSMPAGAPPTPVSKGREYSAEEFNSLPLSDFDVMTQKGAFRKTSDGKFVYTPRG